MGTRPKEIVSFNMSRIRSKGSIIELTLENLLKTTGVPYESHPKMYGKPDFILPNHRIAIFVDSDFWHGYNWEEKKKEIKANQDFWIPKIEKTIARDMAVTKKLQKEGWQVLRFWGHDLKKKPFICRDHILSILDQIKDEPE